MRQHELRRVPQLVAEVAVALDALEVKGEVPALGRHRAEGEAERVRAVGGYAVRVLPARALRYRRRHLRLRHVGGAFGHQIFGGDAVDQVERVQTVAARLGHLGAARVAHHAVDVDLAERHLAGELERHHDHPRNPEEDDVVAGEQHVGGMERGELRRPLRPAQGAERPQRGRKPRVEHVVVLAQRHLRANAVTDARFGLVARHVDVAGVVVPRRNAVPPPLLAADAPILNVAHPSEIHVLVLFRHEAHGAVLHGANGGFGQRRDLHEPLISEPRFDHGFRAVAPGHGVGMLPHPFEKAGGG